LLIEFRVKNHRSLRDEQVLSMVAGPGGDKDDPRPRKVAGYDKELLPVAALYGANASGKSNVLSALAFFNEAVVLSHWAWPPKSIPRDPFAWGPQRDDPSLYEIEFVLESTRYRYGFTVSDEQFLEEWLYAWPHQHKQTWFVRENGKFKFGDSLKGENRLIEEITRPNALFLSAASQHRHPQLTPIFLSFMDTRNPRWRSPRSEVLFAATKRRSSDVLTLLRHADVGIVDMRVEESREGDRGIRFKHQSEKNEAWLPLEEESRGTRTLFEMADPILNTLDTGGVFLADDLEAGLHPALAHSIVQLFNDPKSNERNAQLILTTHDTNLLGPSLGSAALRRDQVWLTEKDEQGATKLYPLTDFKPRKAENIERGYLQGRYGAIPYLGDFSVLAD
jgi:uncharacterized protein